MRRPALEKLQTKTRGLKTPEAGDLVRFAPAFRRCLGYSELTLTWQIEVEGGSVSRAAGHRQCGWDTVPVSVPGTGLALERQT